LNEMKLELESRSVNESFARAVVGAFAAQLDPTVEELGDIKTAVSEAVTNSIVHAYPNEIGKIQLRCRVFDDSVLELQIKDWGVGIADVAQALEPLFTTGGDERSGMGFSMMEGFTDSLRVRSAVGKGTTVTMKKRVISRAQRTQG
jgi:stage II sporulation protein AB (anti-sigma F factor)